MLDLDELKQLVLFSEKGSLSSVASECFISTPSVTRSMQHLECVFGVTLFTRRKNKIELNDTGLLAVEAAKSILAEHERQLEIVRDFDRKQNEITVCTCAPAPLWQLIPKLSSANPDKTVASRILGVEQVVEAYENGSCEYAVLPFPYEDFVPLLVERLFVAVKANHALACRSNLSFADLDGLSFLIRSEVGFWRKLCEEEMPSSKFLAQKDAFEFAELVRSSDLPCFATDVGVDNGFTYEDRVLVPISDAIASVTFYINRMP